MNVVLFPSAFHPSLGGVEELTRQLGREYRQRGTGVVVLTERWPRDLPARENVDGLPVIRLPFRTPEGTPRRRAVHALTERRTLARVVAALREHRCDLVHVQCVSGNGHYARLAAGALGLPLVVTVQGERTMDASGIYQKSHFLNESLRRLVDAADAVTACSGQTLADLENWRGRGFGGRARIVYNGISLAEFDHAPEPQPAGRPYVLAIGRHVPQKGFDLLLRAFDAAETGDHDLVIAGDGPERGELERLARTLGKSDRVRFVGRADRAAAVKLFKGCSFFVLSSRHEPQGIVVLEAMAAGKAVAAARVGGVPEVVDEGRTGLMFDPLDANDFAATLTRLAGDESLRRRLGEAGRAKVEAFDWPRVADEYERVYADAVKHHARRKSGEEPASARPTLCMIHEAIGPQNAIAKVAAAGVLAASSAGWDVTMVAAEVDPELCGRAEWLRMRRPKRGFALQWTTARLRIKAAMRGRSFDVVHAHQPQAAALADVFQCHFLTRRAYERGVLGSGKGWRSRLSSAQVRLMLGVEDRIYRHWPARCLMLYNSEQTRRDFHDLYGELPREAVLTLACPAYEPASEAERNAARRRLLGTETTDGLVIGYVGGLAERKGYRRLWSALATEAEAGLAFTLLMAGYGTGDLRDEDLPPPLRGRVVGVGIMDDVRPIYDASDVIVLPSVYEPLGLVAFEAVARGVPVVATPEVGALPLLLEHGAGVEWNPSGPIKPIGPALREVEGHRDALSDGGEALARAQSQAAYAEALVSWYTRALTPAGRAGEAALGQRRAMLPSDPTASAAGEVA